MSEAMSLTITVNGAVAASTGEQAISAENQVASEQGCPYFDDFH
jgi:hypothetical protein